MAPASKATVVVGFSAGGGGLEPVGDLVAGLGRVSGYNAATDDSRSVRG